MVWWLGCSWLFQTAVSLDRWEKEAEDSSLDTTCISLLLLLLTERNSLLCLPAEGIPSFNKLYEQSCWV